MKRLKYFLVLFVSLLMNIIFAQDVEFSQFYAAPLHLNPSLAGINFIPRIILNYRNQWPRLNNAYVTYAASYDRHIENINGGIGVMILADRAAGGIYNAYTVNLCYAYLLPVNKKMNVRIGIQPSFTHRNIDWSSLTFGDMINSRYGFVDINGNPNPSLQTFPSSTVSYFDVASGIFAYSKKLYFGLGVKHLLRPKEGLIEKSNLPIRYAIHGGAVFYLDKKNNKPKNYLSPNIMFVKQNKYQQLNIGSYIGIDAVFFGFWLRHTFQNSDAFITLLGLTTKYFKVGYSYDWTLSPLKKATGGAHEISLIFNLVKGNSGLDSGSKGNHKFIECPKFF